MLKGPVSRQIPVGTMFILAIFGFLLLYLILKAYTEPTWSAIAGFRETTVSRTETKNVYNREGEIKSVTSQEILPQRTVWDWLSLVGIPLARYLQELWIGFRSRGDLLLASFYQFSISELCSCPDQRHQMRSG